VFTEEFRDRYEQLKELGETPAHYLTHFSSAMIVVSFLVRLRPFNQDFMDLQGGSFDHPDRMFSSIRGAWESASK
jgi:beige protein homolog 1